MKTIFSILFSILILFPLISKTLVIFWFEFNQIEISNTICINKNNPERKDCKGCCVLNEKLNKIEQKDATAETNNSPKQKEKEEFQWLSLNSKLQFGKQFENYMVILNNEISMYKDDPFLAEIIKPPCI